MPEDEDDLAYFLANLPRDIPVTVVGLGSNLIVRDGGVPGVVIRLGRGFNEIDDRRGQPRPRRRRGAGREGRAGRAGGRHRRARVPARHSGRDRRRAAHERRRLWRRDQGRADRGARRRPRRQRRVLIPMPTWASPIGIAASPDDVIFTAGAVRGRAGRPRGDRRRDGRDHRAAREATQPIKSRTGGSTFKNPPGHKAWQLIDAAGCRGLTRRRRAGVRAALQFPDQSRRRDGGRYREPRRGSAPAREGEFRRRARMGDQADRRVSESSSSASIENKTELD